MSDTSNRLVNCFLNVFPDIQPAEVPRASTASLPAWDSAAHITLLSAVCEEFGFDMPAEDYEHLVSFGLIADYLETRTANG
jgi:acyl carrier protein